MRRAIPSDRPRTTLAALTLVTAAALAVMGITAGPSVADRNMAASVMVMDKDGHGSGVAISPTLILTANHVVADAGQYRIRTAAGDEHPVEVVWQSPSRDVALLRITDTARLAHADLACRKPVVGEPVTAIGSPLDARFVVTTGRIASVHPIEDKDYDPTDVTVDIAMAWGNSGGPLFDEDGRIIGLADKVLLHQIGAGATMIPLGVIVPSWRICQLLAR